MKQRADNHQPDSLVQDLANYRPDVSYTRGRSLFVLGIWTVVDALLVSSWVPGSRHRRGLLRAFGAEIGDGVVIKPRARIKFPWKLSVGDFSWIGESVWIDNLAPVDIGSRVCISQGAYICTGNHNWRSVGFELNAKPVVVGSEAWIAAGSVVGPGVQVGAGSVLSLASVATADLEPNAIYQGNPAKKIRTRSTNNEVTSEIPMERPE